MLADTVNGFSYICWRRLDAKPLSSLGLWDGVASTYGSHQGIHDGWTFVHVIRITCGDYGF